MLYTEKEATIRNANKGIWGQLSYDTEQEMSHNNQSWLEKSAFSRT
jgi:hypothetical protein